MRRAYFLWSMMMTDLEKLMSAIHFSTGHTPIQVLVWAYDIARCNTSKAVILTKQSAAIIAVNELTNSERTEALALAKEMRIADAREIELDECDSVEVTSKRLGAAFEKSSCTAKNGEFVGVATSRNIDNTINIIPAPDYAWLFSPSRRSTVTDKDVLIVPLDQLRAAMEACEGEEVGG